MDLSAGVTAQETGNLQFIAQAGKLLPFHRETAVHSRTTGTAGQENALVLGIQIDHAMSLQHGQVDLSGTVHPDFLIHRDDHFQTGMLDLFGIQQSQCVCYSDAVISSEAGTLCVDIVSVNADLQSFRLHIHGAFRCLHRYHIHVSLQDHYWLILISGSCFLDNDHIFHSILYIEKLMCFRKIYQKITDLLHIAGSVRDLRDLFKIVKYLLRF